MDIIRLVKKQYFSPYHKHTQLPKHANILIYIYIHIYNCANILIYIHKYNCANILIYIHIHNCANILIYIHKYKCANMHYTSITIKIKLKNSVPHNTYYKVWRKGININATGVSHNINNRSEQIRLFSIF